MSVQSQIDRIANNVQDTLNTIADTGVDVGSGSDALPAAAAALANEKQDKITISGILKGNGNGGVTAAQAGIDYEAPNAVSTHNASSDAHSGLFAGKMPLKTSGVTITSNTTLGTSHAEKMLLVDSDSAVTITVQSDSTIPDGSLVNIVAVGTGAVTLAASGVTLKTKDGKIKIDGQYAAVTLYKESSTIWHGWGALA